MAEINFAPLPFAPEFEFAAYTQQGWDCPMRHLPSCPHLRAGERHGLHPDEWCFIVRKDCIALELVVTSDRLAGERVAGHCHYPEPSVLMVHGQRPTDESETIGACAITGNCKCAIVWRGGLAATNVWREAQGVDGVDQREGFWRVMHSWWLKLVPDTVQQADEFDKRIAEERRIKRLHDAAPKMLEALKVTLGNLRSLKHNAFAKHDTLDFWIESVEAAVADAEGA